MTWLWRNQTHSFLLLMNLLHDVFEVTCLLHEEDADDDDESKSEARLLVELMRGFRFIFPNHMLSTLSKSKNLGKKEERDSSHSLDGVIQIELISRNILWSLSLKFFWSWWWRWVMLSMSSMRRWWEICHHHGMVFSCKLGVKGTNNSNQSYKHQTS